MKWIQKVCAKFFEVIFWASLFLANSHALQSVFCKFSKKAFFPMELLKILISNPWKLFHHQRLIPFFFFFDLLNELFELCRTSGRFITTKKSIKSLHCVELSRLLSTAGLSSCFISTGVASNKNSYSNGLPYKSYSEKFRKIHKNSFSRVFLK